MRILILLVWIIGGLQAQQCVPILNPLTGLLDCVGSGAGGGAPTGAQYVTLAGDATLTAERILTAGTNVELVDGGAGSTVTINATDGNLRVTRTSGTVLGIGAGVVRVGNVATSKSAATATLSSGSGTARIYSTVDGSIVVGYSTSSGIVCSGCTAVPDVTAFPADSTPIATATYTVGIWDVSGITDLRTRVVRDVILAGSGILVSSNADGSKTVSATGGGGGATVAKTTFASLPGTCTTGNLYLFTNSLYTHALCEASNTYAYFADGKEIGTRITEMGSWSNAGTAGTVDETNGYTTLTAIGDGSGANWFRYTTAPSAPFTRTFVIRPFLATRNYSSIYVGFRQGSGANAGRVHVLRISYASGVVSNIFHMATSRYNGGTYVSDDQLWADAAISSFMTGGYLYLRIQDDGTTNITFSWSLDGVTFRNATAIARSVYVDMAETPQVVIGVQGALDVNNLYTPIAHFLGTLE